MTEGQINLFRFKYNTTTPAILFWQQKMLQLSTQEADLQRKCGVLYSTAIYELQAVRDALNLAESQLSPEQIFEAAMEHATEIRLPAPSGTQTLTFGKTQLRSPFARSFSLSMQRDQAVTTAYALLKFGLSGCATSHDNTGIFLPTDNPVQVAAERRAHDHLLQTNVDTASHGMQTVTMPAYATAPQSFAQQVLNYLAGHDTKGDIDVPALYAKTYDEYPHDAGLRCFPASLLDFNPCHKAMWSAAYDDNLRVIVLTDCTRSLQAHVHSLESSIYGAYTVACIAQQHARLAQRGIAITTLPSSPWNLWEAILTGAGLRPLGYSIAHALTLMAKS
jgi:hypothetical protein